MQISAGGIIAAVFLILCAAIDIKSREIPVWIIILFGISAAAYIGICGQIQLVSIAYSLIPGASLLALSLCTKESIGYGDGWIVLILGIFTGVETCLLIVTAALIFSALSAAVLLMLKKVNGKSRIPFLPFLTMGLGVVFYAQSCF